MTDRGLQATVQFIRQIADPGRAAVLQDGELLRRFIEQRDETAFAALVGRHGPLVLGVCQRVLRNVPDSEDAFQATFLVLIRKARSIVKQRSVGSWLHGVAYRVAVRAKKDLVRRRRCEAQGSKESVPDGLQELAWRDLRPVLDEEVQRLPARCRMALVLCYLEGRTTEEAAGLLRCPRGTVLSRLARARELLRARLVRRGLGASTGLIAAMLPGSATEAAVPAGLSEAVLRSAAGKTVAGGAISARAAHLAEGVMRAMLLAKVRTAGALLLSACLIAGGGVMLAQPSSTGKPPDGGKVATQEPASKEAAPGGPAPAEAHPAWGKPKDGLRIGIVLGKEATGGSGRVQLSVALENVSKDDLVLNLGIMLANGKRQLPEAVRLTLTDAANKTRILHLHLKMPGIAGRVDPFVVPLPAGCRYTLACLLDDYADDDLAVRGISLPPGRYQATAEFLGKAITREDTRQDMLFLMRYWTGTVASGEAPITVPAQR